MDKYKVDHWTYDDRETLVWASDGRALTENEIKEVAHWHGIIKKLTNNNKYIILE